MALTTVGWLFGQALGAWRLAGDQQTGESDCTLVSLGQLCEGRWGKGRGGQTKSLLLLLHNNNNNNNDFISKALFHVKHAQLRCTMPMNNTYTHARASKTSDERTIAYKSLKHNTIC